MNYVKLYFENLDEQYIDLIPALLSDTDVQGFEQNDTSLIAYYYEADFREVELHELLSPFSITFSKELIPHENWNAQWESNFEPIIINSEVGLRAHFHAPFTNCKYDIEITPKMSFGTGHHQTTHMMVEFACETDFITKSVFDFGCGTGVLAILAKLKGATSVLGIDHDAWSIENATENCAKNNCSDIEISKQDISTITKSFDIILANINLNVLLETMHFLKNRLNPQGSIYLSGILESDIPTLTACFESFGFRLVSKKQRNDWVALHIK